MENWKEIAKQNGINASMFLNRVNQYGWSPEKAATTPVIQRKRPDQEWIQLAKKNGITYKNYLNRLDLGWSPEEAATKPPGYRRKSRKDAEWIKIAEDNGISSRTYRYRVDKFGWSQEEAATKSVIKRDDQEWVKIAHGNGIPYSTYYNRVDELFWPPEEAATIPPLDVEEIAKRSVKNRKQYDEIRWERINKDPNNLFKFTPQHIEEAAKNGINEFTFRSRIYNQGLTVQEAISKPVKKKRSDEFYRYLDVARNNGISYRTYLDRVERGWSFHDAATKELQDNSKRRRPDAEWMDKAIENGIKGATYRFRIKRGWTPEEAATVPTLKNGEFLNEQTREKKREGFKKFRRMKKRG